MSTPHTAETGIIKKQLSNGLTVLLKEDHAAALEVQADAMMNSTFDVEEFTRERLVVIDEARMYDDRPESFTFYRTMELGFDKHTYRRPIAGYQDIVEKITRDQLVEFYNNYYRPSNAVLVVVGDVDPDRAMAEIEKTYGVWKPGKVAINEPPVEPAQKKFRFKGYEGPQEHGPFPEVVVNQQQRVSGENIAPPLAWSRGLRVGDNRTPNQSHFPTLSSRACTEFVFVAVSKIALIEQTDVSETFASHDHERAMRNINAFDVAGARWINELV